MRRTRASYASRVTVACGAGAASPARRIERPQRRRRRAQPLHHASMRAHAPSYARARSPVPRSPTSTARRPSACRAGCRRSTSVSVITKHSSGRPRSSGARPAAPRSAHEVVAEPADRAAAEARQPGRHRGRQLGQVVVDVRAAAPPPSLARRRESAVDGGLRTSTASPRARTTARGPTPTKLYAAHFSPPTTLSSRNEYAPRPSLAYADTGVSVSASTSR